MQGFYAMVGMGMVVAAIFWIASPRSRLKIKRLAFLVGRRVQLFPGELAAC